MKKLLIAIPLVLAVFFTYAQGIKFEHGQSWQQIKERAKKDNKYIFVDCFTTWCGPCKEMEKEVYPSEKAGAFYNQYFLNVKVQMDKTGKDSKEIKAGYSDAEQLMKTYQVSAFPTFLFFSPDGKLVHRSIGFLSAAGLVMMGHDVINADSPPSQAGREETKAASHAAILDKQALIDPFGKNKRPEYGSDTAWANYARRIDEKYQKVPPTTGEGQTGDSWVLNTSAWHVFESCNEREVLERALVWSNVSVDLSLKIDMSKGSDSTAVNGQILDTKANLLYKLGRAPEAIALEERILQNCKITIPESRGILRETIIKMYQTEIDKMKKSEPTWVVVK